jgi:protein gp37
MSKIEWCDITVNPFRGCTKVSPACDNCYALPITHRQYYNERLPDDVREASLKAVQVRGNGPEWSGKVTPVPSQFKKIYALIKDKKPKRVFVGSLTDLFHANVDINQVNSLIGCMGAAPQHIFMLLTKRPENALQYCRMFGLMPWPPAMQMAEGVEPRLCSTPSGEVWPPNVWLGVTAENQAMADERIPILLQIPAAVRFVSVEPMLGPVDLAHLQPDDPPVEIDALAGTHGVLRPHGGENHRLDWVICGGESGPRARPMHPDWARSLRDQCIGAGVPFFFKQWGEWGPIECAPDNLAPIYQHKKDGVAQNGLVYRIGKKAAGRELDGKTWDQRPERD